MWLKKTQKNKPCHMRKGTYWCYGLHYWNSSHSLIKSHTITYCWAGVEEQGMWTARGKGLQPLSLPLPCCTLCVSSWICEHRTRGAASAAAFKMQMHFQMQTSSFFSLFPGLSSCKCDFGLNFFLQISSLGFEGYMCIPADYLRCCAYTHNRCASYWQL